MAPEGLLLQRTVMYGCAWDPRFIQETQSPFRLHSLLAPFFHSKAPQI